ncbi:hypothetical protein AXF42_Ash002870 [Apostasia shenzhenica]|uniref:BHLH domain-containing protein n=1 Tax=Apostasia shenzhenica TaxID=1088818 RepID=A0A2I0A7J7_9ASPA|nr:hypothetical protein AXF42_Ash002870 [Apostasia shenzhenica]
MEELSSETSKRRARVPARRRAVRKKVRELQRLVPGGNDLRRPELLYARAADYILLLRMKVHVLRALSKMYTA